MVLVPENGKLRHNLGLPGIATQRIMFTMAKDRQDKPGPKPHHLKLEGDWEQAMKKVLKKEKPKEGWPEDKDKPKKK
jgi:hypothetical protein